MPFQPKRDCAEGFVYVAQCKDVFKIGFSKRPDQRILSVRTKTRHLMPELSLDDLHIIHCIPTNNMAFAERSLHNFFAEYRLKPEYPCEWFYLPESVITWLLSISHINVL